MKTKIIIICTIAALAVAIMWLLIYQNKCRVCALIATCPYKNSRTRRRVSSVLTSAGTHGGIIIANPSIRRSVHSAARNSTETPAENIAITHIILNIGSGRR